MTETQMAMRQAREPEADRLLRRVDRLLATAADRDGALTAVVEAIHESSDRYDWTGIYLVEGDHLVLHNYLGAPSPHGRIPIGQGVCGAAAAEKRTIIVPDVHADARYLSCSLETRSEIVVPITKLGYVFGEIDIDSHRPDAFTDADRRTLEEIARRLSSLF
jgi:GAF domain-containing protein